MTLDDALALLGLSRETTWPDIRRAYRARMRVVHPDVTAGRGTGAVDAVGLNEAFALLERVYRRNEPMEPASRAPAAPPVDLVLVDDDGLALVAPPEEVFQRLAGALDEIGAVTYADHETGYLEAVIANGTGQLVVSLQGRAHATEAFFTLEPLGTAPVPPIEQVVRLLASRLRAARDS